MALPHINISQEDIGKTLKVLVDSKKQYLEGVIIGYHNFRSRFVAWVPETQNYERVIFKHIKEDE